MFKIDLIVWKLDESVSLNPSGDGRFKIDLIVWKPVHSYKVIVLFCSLKLT